jgi:hypothetical protein
VSVDVTFPKSDLKIIDDLDEARELLRDEPDKK